MEDESIISLRDISVYYKLYRNPDDRLKEALHPFRKIYHKRFYALENIDLEIRRGTVLGIVGRNGSGKSTLLKVIAGVLTSSSGRSVVNGRILALLELGSGMNPNLSGIENIYFYGAILGLSKADMDNRIDDILSFADLGEFIYQPLKTYSSGMKARLAFAVSVNTEPDIFIVDEVMAVGDAPFRAKCYSRIRQMISNGVTVLYVSHAIDSVRNLCDECVYLNEGRIIAAGSAKYICDLYESDCRKAQGALENKINNAGAFSENLNNTSPKIDGSIKNISFSEYANLQREGNKAAQLVDVYLADAKGEVISQVNYDEEVNVVAKIIFNKDMRCIIHSGVDIKTLEGIRVMNCTDPVFDSSVSLTKGQYARLHIPIRFPLAALKYYMTIGIWAFPEGAKFVEGQIDFANGELLDLVEYSYYFSVLVYKQHPARGPVTIHVKQQLEV